jgi:hypothetical protein
MALIRGDGHIEVCLQVGDDRGGLPQRLAAAELVADTDFCAILLDERCGAAHKIEVSEGRGGFRPADPLVLVDDDVLRFVHEHALAIRSLTSVRSGSKSLRM